jgi:hypothetical protein
MKQSIKHMFKVSLLTVCAMLLFVSSAFAAEITPEMLERWEKEGIDVNHMETIEKLRAYLAENIDQSMFAGLYIDREEVLTGTIVLAFTEELSAETKAELEALVQPPALLKIRTVTFTEEELLAKQREIDTAVFGEYIGGDPLDLDSEFVVAENPFQEYGFEVTNTGVDVIHNRVEIGILPYTSENAEIVYDMFGREMIHVVEGARFELLYDGFASDSASAGTAEAVTPIAAEANQGSLFERVVSWLKQLFSK